LGLKQVIGTIAALLAIAGLASSGSGQTPAQPLAQPAPTVRPAVEGILAAFATHPLVGIADDHGMAQEQDFYADLVRHPRFAREVGNVVVEFGGAAHQDIIDRYLAGETVPYTELRKVWTNTVGWVPLVSYLGFLNFYAQVRLVNLGLPPEQRIRVWLGEPPIDWSKINSRADLMPFIARRDAHAAEIIRREILAKRKKALVIYGGAHFFDSAHPLRGLVESDHPKALFLVMPYGGHNEKSCDANFEKSISGWPVPALATPVRGTSLATAVLAPGCSRLPGLPPMNEQERKTRMEIEEGLAGLAGDALLYLGPSATLTTSLTSPDIYLDEEYRQEIARRYQIQTGRTLSSAIPRVSPRLQRPNQR